MVDPSLANCAERNLGGGAGLADERTSKESPCGNTTAYWSALIPVTVALTFAVPG